MSNLIDDVARILAAPIPRRQALGLLRGVLAGGVLGGFGAKYLGAATPELACPTGTIPCGKLCCPAKTVCCSPRGNLPFCLPAGHTCCGTIGCLPGRTCCTTASSPYCVTKGKICCGKTACSPGQTCCNGVCCQPHQICKNGRCQASNS